MAIVNLASTHSAQCGERYFLKSKLRDVLMDKSNLEFDGNQTVIVHTPEPLSIQRYNRNGGTSRFGTMETAGDTTQRFQLGYEWSFTGSFDAGDMSDSGAYKKQCHKQLKLQQDEAITPALDKMALFEIAHHAGKIYGGAALSNSNIIEAISQAQTDVYNASKGTDNSFLIIGASKYHLVRTSSAFEVSDKLGTEQLEKGIVGRLFNLTVQMLPDEYMPPNVQFMIIRKDACFAHEKITTARVLNEVMGIDGSVIEGHYYAGAFVRAEKCGGVYVYASSSAVSAAPTLSKSGTTVSSSAAGSGNQILYTVDGSDPRYSDTAQVYSSGVACQSGDVFKAVVVPVIPANQLPEEIAASTAKFASPVAEITV